MELISTPGGSRPATAAGLWRALSPTRGWTPSVPLGARTRNVEWIWGSGGLGMDGKEALFGTISIGEGQMVNSP